MDSKKQSSQVCRNGAHPPVSRNESLPTDVSVAAFRAGGPSSASNSHVLLLISSFHRSDLGLSPWSVASAPPNISTLLFFQQAMQGPARGDGQCFVESSFVHVQVFVSSKKVSLDMA